DGVPLHTNDLVLVWQQADKTQNGVYLVNLSPTINGGNWLRAGNLNSNEKFEGGLVVRTGPEGTVFPYQVFQLAANVDSNDAEIPYVL
ncbi:hypothetical protein ACI4CU_28025, partial [Klebsiella pneumoniae]|uniref:hypothetical protein n=1 Tax=Klebsiella pneumoniae TaxID=573 RepID=UPI003853BA92